MSRIGKKPIIIPAGVSITEVKGAVEVKGPKGMVSVPNVQYIKLNITAAEIVVERTNDQKQARANHGLIRSLLQNAVVGVTEGFVKTLKLVGTGYRVQAKGQGISLAVGFSHTVEVPAKDGLSFSVQGNDTIVITGVDKQRVGQIAAEIRSIRPPEPYKGKGVRYQDEVVRRKQGKTASA
ncbi:MAG: 50S ribosomal protein L6 [Candidatus Pacebacteria bacterium CG_4_10_14_0_8_um_filter_42_14]|nr:MAG: 50S ribosomal protein L6 [Candidatus Pacebacteria bacterium CG_4_10_14_0_8_um_filter_42_14]